MSVRWFLVLLFASWSCGGGDSVGIDVVGDLPVDTAAETTSVDIRFADTAPPDSPHPEDTSWDAEVSAELPFEVADPCETNPGGFGCECAADGDCDSGYCVQFQTGRQCTKACLEDCPEGFDCALVADSCPDCMFICVPDFVHLCKPCTEHSDCGDPKVESPDLCVDFGEEGRFCGASCLYKDCPEGYECQSVDVGGGLESPQCVAVEGLCGCSELAIDEGAATICYQENEHGVCEGSRTCTEDGLTACDAPLAEAELCDGLDNDCNGLADDAIEPTVCVEENDHGACEGTEICAGGVGVCDAAVPAAELCDGQDNDCDGQVDEGSSDTDEDGIANCVDEDDDGDGVPDETDLCPLVPDPEQADADYDLIGDLCDPDDDNDLHPDVDDCQPTDPDSHPGADEVCDGVDNDCDLWVDEATCDDDNPCTDDSCDPSLGCQYIPNEKPCEDGDPCTSGDACQDGQCLGGLDVCPCQEDADCEALGFIGGCVGMLYCDKESMPYACKVDPAQAEPCPPSVDPCTLTGCDVNTGDCLTTDAAEGTPCDDGDPCTLQDACADGLCAGGPAPNCDDGNPCTDDSCDQGTGCVHIDNTLPCNDGDPCTTTDTCAAGACVGGQALACDDDNPCTSDSCDPGIGCQFQNNSAACDDGNECTTGDACAGGWCKGTGILVCDDGNPCTNDACEPATGCVHEDNDELCNDGDPCTLIDACTDGTCVGTGNLECDDGDPCTDDVCAQGTGCVHTHNTAPCDDGDECTTDDACSGGACVGGSAPDCDDDNLCTDDSCDPDIGCLHQNNALVCDDGDECTLNDQCQAGQCVGGQAPDCDDSNVCTDDGCDPDIGCVNTNNTAPCEDGDPCTADDVCDGGQCSPGTAGCDDGDPCTADSCTEDGDCLHEADLADPACSEWVYEPTAPTVCFLTQAPALTETGELWALGRTTCESGVSKVQTTRLVGLDSATGEHVGQFMVDSPASQPAYRQGRITMSFDWNSSYLHGAIGSYGLPGGAISWQHSIGEHPRGGISMDENGTMYVNKHGTRAINWSGSTLWSGKGTSYYIGGGTWIMGDGYIIGCEKYNDCTRISPAGAVSWTLNLGCRPGGSNSLSHVLFPCRDQGVKVYTSNKTHLWTYDPDGVSFNSLLVGENDQIVAGTDTGQAMVLSVAGTQIAAIDVCPHSEESTFKPWLLTDDGWVYGTCKSCDVENNCYDYRAVGANLADPGDLWHLASPDPVHWISLTSDGHLVILTGDKIYRLTIGDLTLLSSPWPTVDHDLARTRNGKTEN